MTRLTLQRGVVVFALGAQLLFAASAQASDDGVPDPAWSALSEIRRVTGCVVAPVDDRTQELLIRGRESIEFKGRSADASGVLRDLAVFGRSAGRIVSYVCFVNASTRSSGEAVLSLAEISNRADRFARALFPTSRLELEGVKRHRSGQTESIYYEARYSPASSEFPFFEPPVRLLLNATTGSFFRLDIDPDWLNPADPARVRISQRAAERIAAIVLRNYDLTLAFGAGAVFGSVGAADMFSVRPNDWLGLSREPPDARTRVAWVVPFKVSAEEGAGQHGIFIDAGTGQALGGFSTSPVGRQPR